MLWILLLCGLGAAKVLQPINGVEVPNEYIVVLQDHATVKDCGKHFDALLEFDPFARVLHVYEHTIVGYSVSTTTEAIERVSDLEIVAYVEQNQQVTLTQTCLVAPITRLQGLWGLSRVSYPTPVVPPAPARFSQSVGAPVYIIGINTKHVDFNGRALMVFDSTGEGLFDGNGHGTHCAGTAVGQTYGISKYAQVRGVKVLSSSGSGSYAGVIAGVDFVGNQTGNRVASMSLGGGFSQAMNDAIARLGAKGNVAIALASGNSAADACSFSPASAKSPASLTVNALDEITSLNQSDRRASFSNYGPCTHIFAPGVNILSAWIGSNNATRTISGTSMATPLVASVLSDTWGRMPSMSGAQLRDLVLSRSLSGRVLNAGPGSPNLLLQAACSNC